MLGGLVHMCLSVMLRLLEAKRMSKLMIKYYDALQELAALDHITQSESTPGTSA
jgi:hypothetical protein